MKRRINNQFCGFIKIFVVLFMIFAVVLSGCVDEGRNETAPENTTNGQGTTETNNSKGTTGTNDSQETSGGDYIYGTANVESVQIMTLESFPVQINVIAEGYLPDGCTEIDEIKTEKEGNFFDINISTKRPKDAICTQAIERFTKTIPLEVWGLKAGNYTVNVNGVTGSFELTVDNIIQNGPPSSMPPRQQVVTEADNGKTINLENGETFYLRLPENPSTGYSWELNLTPGLDNVSGKYYPPKQPEGIGQPLVGAGGVRLWEIKAVAEGSQKVTGMYKRSWENETAEEGTFTLNVEVV